MNILIIGASKGLGKALVDGLQSTDNRIIGVSRNYPEDWQDNDGHGVSWIKADMAQVDDAVNIIAEQSPDQLDVIIYNLGIWEADALPMPPLETGLLP